MNTKLTGIVAASMLALMALAPLGLAHNQGTGSNKPTGNYVGGAGPWAQLIASDIVVDDETTVNPGFTFAAGQAFCDMEILSDGDATTPEDAENDEPFIDGVASEQTSGTIEEGTFDDGGLGAVCHTSHYNTQAYNTWGCYTGQKAFAKDVVSAKIWITTGCDFRNTVQGGDDPTPLPGVFAFEDCIANDVILSQNPENTVPCTLTLAGYAGDYDAVLLADCFTGLIQPSNCPEGTGTYTCNNQLADPADRDGASDDGNSGFGGPGVPYPGTDLCSTSAGVAVVFVWDAVVVDNDGVAPNLTAVYAATTGWVK